MWLKTGEADEMRFTQFQAPKPNKRSGDTFILTIIKTIDYSMEETEATLEQRMLIDTLGAFGDGTQADVPAERGLLLLEGWLNALPGSIGIGRILSEIETLRDHLKNGEYDNELIRTLMLNMASHTLTISHEPMVDEMTAHQLGQLANALRNFTNHID